ncbi:Photosystem II 22 kDa protein 1, chloroplastic, partial [Linum perenne]
LLTGLNSVFLQAPPPPPKVEDGIFGTSGGIGFTKQNELFVGRVAMLGIAFSLIGEVITGKGALAQLNIETGIPINEIEPLVLFNVLFFFIAALNPGTGKFVTDDEEK